MRDQYGIGVCAIFLNEAPFLLEWIAYHKSVGVDRFILFDNGSTDGGKEIVLGSQFRELVTLISWPERPGQLSAYQHCIDHYIASFVWMAFIDIDEFIHPLRDCNLPDLLQRAGAHDAMLIQWMNFGPSGYSLEPEGLVLENYTSRLPIERSVNRHVKSIVRSSGVVGVGGCHIARLKGDPCNADGATVENAAIQQEICADTAVINHYYTKSKATWLAKVGRGRASVADTEKQRSYDWFHEYEVYATASDTRISRFIPDTRTALAASLHRADTTVIGKFDRDAVSEKVGHVGEHALQGGQSRGAEQQLIFDVGMSEGNDSAFYLCKGFSVVGIEADIDVCRNLNRRFSSEIGCGRLTIYNRAAGESDGETMEFFHHNKHQGLSGLSKQRHEFANGDYVSYFTSTINWSTLIERHGVPYYMKVDIEGAEAAFLRSMVGHNPLPEYISVECYSIEPVELLYGVGYRLFKLIDQNPVGGFKLPENQMEGDRIHTVDWTHTSGPFGRELSGSHWLDFDQFVEAWEHSKPQLNRTWFDCHAWMPVVSSRISPVSGSGLQKVRPLLKWYFAISHSSVPGNSFLPADSSYVDMVRVAVKSALDNTNLQPHMIYDGSPCDFTDEMVRNGVRVIFHELSFAKAVTSHMPENRLWQRIARGTYLRIDIPLLEQTDQFVLYTDCDIIFRKHPSVEDVSPEYFAAAPEFTRGNYRDFNAGVMLLNVEKLRGSYSAFVDHVKSDIARPGLDQSAMREFYGKDLTQLPEQMNWKPYWGDFSDAEVLHFHGPKPFQIKMLDEDGQNSYDPVIKQLYEQDKKANSSAASLFFQMLDSYKSRAIR